MKKLFKEPEIDLLLIDIKATIATLGESENNVDDNWEEGWNDPQNP